MKKVYIFSLITILTVNATYAGRKIDRWSLGIALGAANFLGEAGGTDGLGRNNFKDVKFNQTKFSGGIYGSYRFNRWAAVGLNLYYARLSGADSLSSTTGDGSHRYYRNSSFRNDVFEASLQAELTIYSNIQYGHRYRLYGIKGRKKFNFRLYALGGVGVFYHNPKTLYEPTGKYIELKPLGTEGQNIPGVGKDKQYSNFSVNFPVGLGITYKINDHISIGYEISGRYTLTDYIDDVSNGPYLPDSLFPTPEGKYIMNRPKIDEANAAKAGLGENYRPGTSTPRGSAKQNDYYLYSLVKLTFVLPENITKKHRPKYEKSIKLVKPKDRIAKPKDNR